MVCSILVFFRFLAISSEKVMAHLPRQKTKTWFFFYLKNSRFLMQVTLHLVPQIIFFIAMCCTFYWKYSNKISSLSFLSIHAFCVFQKICFFTKFIVSQHSCCLAQFSVFLIYFEIINLPDSDCLRSHSLPFYIFLIMYKDLAHP